MDLLRNNIGIPRVRMPQLAGYPAEGSKAASLPREKNFGGVDLGTPFWDHLVSLGYGLEHFRIDPKELFATQNELNWGKVETLTRLLREGKLEEACIFISADNHVIDGHHRWAASVLAGVKDIPVSRINLPIREVLVHALAFEREWGPLK